MIGRYCIVCGCTESTACPGRCNWVADNRCSSCAGIVIHRGLTPEEAAALNHIYRSTPIHMAGSLRRVLSMHLHSGRMTVRIESGDYAWRLTPVGREFLAAVRKAEATAAAATG